MAVLAVSLMMPACASDSTLTAQRLAERALSTSKPPVMPSLARLVFARAGDSSFVWLTPTVEVNGATVGQIARGDTLVHDVPAGAISVIVSMPMERSQPTHRFNVTAGSLNIFDVSPVDSGKYERALATTLALNLAFGWTLRPSVPFAVTPVPPHPMGTLPLAPSRTTGEQTASPSGDIMVKCQLSALGALTMSAERCAGHGGKVIGK